MARNADPLPRVANVVVLRRLAASDLRAFQAYRNDPVVAQYQGWSAKSDAEATAFLTRMGDVALLQPGIWSQIGIADPASLALVGDIGLLLAGDGREVEIGFTLRPRSQGHGIGTAAVRAAIELVFEHTRADRVLGITDARNLPSIRLLQRAGMHMTGTREAMFRDEPCVEHVYAISRPQDE
ncbi:MAG: GNAT family N-acetyltransferase [Burkholderiales bacterium]|nr:GNAT family N-acetyltransferase [Burkholderiales bacterium]